MRSWLQRFGIRLLGLGLLVYVILTSDWRMIREVFGRVSFPELVAITLLGVLVWVIKAWRWHYLLRLQSIRYPFGRALLVYVYTMGLGLLSPGRLGEFSKIAFLQSETDTSLAQGLIGAVADRLLDLLMLSLVALFGIGVFVWSLTALAALLATLATLALGLLLVALFAHLRPKRLWSLYVNRLSCYGRWGSMVASGGNAIAHESVKLLQPRLSLALLASGLATTVYFWQSALFAHQLGLALTVLQVGFALALASIVSLLPISVAGLGTREATLIFAFGLYGLSQSEAVSYSLLLFAVYLMTSILVTGTLSLAMRSDHVRPGRSDSQVLDGPDSGPIVSPEG